MEIQFGETMLLFQTVERVPIDKNAKGNTKKLEVQKPDEGKKIKDRQKFLANEETRLKTEIKDLTRHGVIYRATRNLSPGDLVYGAFNVHNFKIRDIMGVCDHFERSGYFQGSTLLMVTDVDKQYVTFIGATRFSQSGYISNGKTYDRELFKEYVSTKLSGDNKIKGEASGGMSYVGVVKPGSTLEVHLKASTNYLKVKESVLVKLVM